MLFILSYLHFYFRPSCQLEVVKALLEAKADPNLTDGKHNRCSLSYAVTNRSGKYLLFTMVLRIHLVGISVKIAWISFDVTSTRQDNIVGHMYHFSL